MFSSKKLIFIFSALIIASMVLAACAPAAEPCTRRRTRDRNGRCDRDRRG
jgi:hypothetical protein